jgi:hypothetical protein
VDDLDFLDQAYDQAPPGDGARRLLFVCTTPRTGSHRLGRALYDLGLGVQAEYFHPNTLDMLGTRWGVAGDRQSPGWLDAYWQEVLRRRTRGGVVAVSIFGFQLGILKRLIGPDDQPIFVHLYRRSAADQIASLLTLYQTKMPYENNKIMANIPDIGEVSPRAIRILHQWLALQNRKWRGFLADKPHLTTSSEDFFRQPGDILRAILAQGEIAVAPARLDAAAQLVRRSRAYSANAAIKQQLMRDHAATLAALAQDIDGAGMSTSDQCAKRMD